ncbi:MAG: class I SAM-dependent methyltransferase [Bacteroidales bacterium]
MYPRLLQRFDEFLVKSVDFYVNYRWYHSPITSKILASKEKYLELAEKAKAVNYPETGIYEKETGYAIDAEWFHTLALRTQVVIKKSEICYAHGRLLYACLRKYLEKNGNYTVNILETGTARGFSSVCMAKALEDSNVEGKIFTFDVLPHQTRMYWNCIADHEGKMTREELLAGYCVYTNRYIVFKQGNTRIELNKMHLDRVNFAFLDGSHSFKDVMFEFNYLKKRQIKGDIIFFDDYSQNRFPGIVKAVDKICKEFGYSKQILSAGQNRAYVIAEKH